MQLNRYHCDIEDFYASRDVPLSFEDKEIVGLWGMARSRQVPLTTAGALPKGVVGQLAQEHRFADACPALSHGRELHRGETSHDLLRCVAVRVLRVA